MAVLRDGLVAATGRPRAHAQAKQSLRVWPLMRKAWSDRERPARLIESGHSSRRPASRCTQSWIVLRVLTREPCHQGDRSNLVLSLIRVCSRLLRTAPALLWRKGAGLTHRGPITKESGSARSRSVLTARPGPGSQARRRLRLPVPPCGNPSGC